MADIFTNKDFASSQLNFITKEKIILQPRQQKSNHLR